ncbi:calcium-activated potassium channel subunit beta-2 isoform 1-T2 [Menidia menidia]
MFLLAGAKAPQGRNERLSIYQRIRDHEVLDRRKTVTALRAGEDRALLLGVSMVLTSIMMYFVLGITILRSYSDSLWTLQDSCTVVNATVMWDVSCSYSCGAECWKRSRYPCLQVYVSLNSSGRVVRLLHDEDVQESNPECFFVPRCRRDLKATRALVQNLGAALRAGPAVACFVAPAGGAPAAILTRVYGPRAAFHSLLWPSCTLVGGAAIVAMVKLTQFLSTMCDRLSRIRG